MSNNIKLESLQPVIKFMGFIVQLISIISVISMVIWWAVTLQADAKYTADTVKKIDVALTKIEQKDKEQDLIINSHEVRIAVFNQILGLK